MRSLYIMIIFTSIIIFAANDLMTGIDKSYSSNMSESINIIRYNESIYEINEDANEMQTDLSEGGVNLGTLATYFFSAGITIVKNTFSIVTYPKNILDNIYADTGAKGGAWLSGIIVSALIVIVGFFVLRSFGVYKGDG